MTRAAPLLLLVLVVLGLGAPANAHSGIQSYVYVSVYDTSVDGRVEYPTNDLGPALGIEFPEDDAAALAVALEQRDAIIEYTSTHLAMSDDDGEWELEFSDDFELLATSAGDYLQVPFKVNRSFDEPVRTWTTTYDGIIESNPERDALFLVENDWLSATFANEGEHLLGFSVGLETQLIEIESASAFEPWWEIGQLGSAAVDRALDQLVIVLGLAAAAVLGTARRAGEQPIRSQLTTTGRNIGLLIAGQSVVLWASGLFSLELAEWIAATAVSVGVIAVALASRVSRAATVPYHLIVGALSGIGLAHAFLASQLDQSRPIRSLLAFNIGTAITVALVTAMWVPALLLLARLRVRELLLRAIGLVVAVLGAVWLVERAAGLKFPLRTAELAASDLVTNPLAVAVVTAVIAAVVIRFGARADGAPEDPADGSRHRDESDERIEVS